MPSTPEEVTRGNNYEEPMITDITQQAGKPDFFKKILKISLKYKWLNLYKLDIEEQPRCYLRA